MMVVHCDFSREWRGGQHQLLLLARGLGRAGWRQLIVARPALLERWRAAGCEALPAGWQAARALRRADVAHAHDARALGWVLLARLGRARPACVASRRVAFPLGVWGAAKYRRAGAVLAVSDFIRAQLLARGLHPDRVSVVRDALDPADLPDAGQARARVRAALGWPPSARCLACSSALTPEKGVMDLIAALPRLESDILVLLAGEGAEEPWLRRQAAHLGVAQRILWTPGRERSEGKSFSIPELIAAADVFVLPSRHEGLGSSLLLALALGRPVVATTAGGIPEIIAADRNGLLVPAADPPALAAAIMTLLRDPARASRLAENGAQSLEARFSPEALAAGTLAAYRAALARRG